MYKDKLRLEYRSKRKALTSTLIADYSIEIANRALSMPIWQFSFYHIFLSITKNKEVDTEPLLSIIQGKDKNVVVPKTYANSIIKSYLLTDSVAIVTNSMGIPEPVEGIEIPDNRMEVVFVPLLAFDIKGNRVGYGGGYYDVFLSKCPPGTLKIGLSFFDAVPAITDVDDNDIALDYCITPNKVYQF